MYQSPMYYNSYYNSRNFACDFVDVNLNTNANLEQRNNFWQSCKKDGGVDTSTASSDFIVEEWDNSSSTTTTGTSNCSNHSSVVYRIQNYVNSREKEKRKRFSDVKFPFGLSKSRRSVFASVDDHVKRPMNGFMVFSQNRRKQLALLYPSMHNAELSKILGNEWKTMKQNDKQIYMLQALSLQKQHSIKHPDYKYRPKRRKNINESTKSQTGTEMNEKIVEETQKCAQKRSESSEKYDQENPTSKLDLSALHLSFKEIAVFEDSPKPHVDLTKNEIQQTSNGTQNEWYTCLRDIYDVDKDEFSKYFPH